MKRLICTYCLWLLTTGNGWGQQSAVRGLVVDSRSNEALTQVSIVLEGTSLETTTDRTGRFLFRAAELPAGEQILVLEKEDYITKRIPIVLVSGQSLDMNTILLEFDLGTVEAQIGIISLSDNELNREAGEASNVAGLLQSSRDVFLNTAAFEFSSTFFRPRGLDNSNGKILINGIEMNKQFNGRPQWANWGGLNDVQRNREFSMGLRANDYHFSDLAGTSYINMRASEYREGGRVSFAAANRSYRGRVMGTYSSGMDLSGWAYTISLARRFGAAAFVEGNPYSANSFFASVEKRLNAKHSFNLLAFFTPNRRGRSTAVTQEVRDLKGIRYNPNWGFQNGDLRNSRMRTVSEPVFILNHFWKLDTKTHLNTNVGFQTGQTGTTRIDNGGTQLIQLDGQDTYIGGGRNPLATYYQRLPSYFLRNQNPTPYDFQLAYQAEQALIDDGQVDWAALYRANELVAATGGNSVYAIQEDRTDDTQWTINSIFDTALAEHITLNAALNYRQLKSENFAQLKDLLGGNGFLDVDFFADDDVNLVVGNLAQSDLRNRNRIAREGERYKYNYELRASVIDGFAQARIDLRNVEVYGALQVGQTTYGRTGLYENGNFPGSRSYGDSQGVSFTTFGAKAGGVYKLKGGHWIDGNLGYFTKAPYLRNTFSNARQNNDLVIGLQAEKIQSVDLSYIYRSPLIKGRIGGYYIGIRDQTDLGFYFTERISGLGMDQDAFIQEIMTRIDTRRMGAELGVEAQLTPTFKLRAAGAFGTYIYTNDPNLYITSDDFEGPLTFGAGTTRLKNYHVAGGPERAFNLALEYRDPSFWWCSLSGNRYSHAYIDVNNLARSDNFASDFDGKPLNDYDPQVARQLLKQERLGSYYLFNAAGGKSWRIHRYFVGFFATINNLLGQEYKTGGFEQGRYTNYRDLQTDQTRTYGSLFGPRYFFGFGTTYYLNLYLRF